MTQDVKADQLLEDELVEALSAEIGLAPSLARDFVLPIVRYLQKQYGGTRLYIASPGRSYDVDEIAAFLDKTRDVNATCSRFGISRTTLYRLIERRRPGEAQGR